MGSPRNVDLFVLCRMLESILKANGNESETAVAGGANVNPETYAQYRDILLTTDDIEMTTRATDGRRVPRITPQGLETLRDLRRHCAKYSKPNLQLEAQRAAMKKQASTQEYDE